MARTNIQVPVTTDLKQKVTKKAEKLGFSSIQDVIRVFLTGFAEDKYTVGINERENIEYLTDKQVELLEKKWKKFQEEEKRGETFTADSLEEMMDILQNAKID